MYELIIITAFHVFLNYVVAWSWRLVATHRVVDFPSDQLSNGHSWVIAIRQRRPERHEFVFMLGGPPQPEHFDTHQCTLEFGPEFGVF